MSKPPGEPQEEAIKIPDVLPVLPLKDTVIFPYVILPLSVGRDKSVLAVPGRRDDPAPSNLELKPAEAQAILETIDPIERLHKVSELVAREIQVLTMQQEISSQARGEMDRSQREYFLRQQLKAIQQELGEGEELSEEIANYRKLAEDRKISDEGKEELERQVKRLERSHPESAETQIIRTYLDWLTALPWQTLSEDNLDLDHAQQVL